MTSNKPKSVDELLEDFFRIIDGKYYMYSPRDLSSHAFKAGYKKAIEQAMQICEKRIEMYKEPKNKSYRGQEEASDIMDLIELLGSE